MAVGILERKGIKKARNLEGGARAWIKQDLPVLEGVKPGVPTEAVPTTKE
jgi:hypothetical protein